jgi:hypothetical protein
VAAVSVVLISAVNASAKSDVCRSGGAFAACTVDISTKNVNRAKVKMGRRTNGNWAMTCSKGGRAYTDQGRVGRGDTDRINVRYRNADCSLAATGSGRNRVKVRVSLN